MLGHRSKPNKLFGVALVVKLDFAFVTFLLMLGTFQILFTQTFKSFFLKPAKKLLITIV